MPHLVSIVVRCRSVVAAPVSFTDSVAAVLIAGRQMDNPEAVPLIEPAAGVHVMFPAHFSPARMGLIVPKTSDGRCGGCARTNFLSLPSRSVLDGTFGRVRLRSPHFADSPVGVEREEGQTQL
eukprot:31606-Eustigmatos_ZCMA.PRE.1